VGDKELASFTDTGGSGFNGVEQFLVGVVGGHRTE
jgi:hypothetical protein